MKTDIDRLMEEAGLDGLVIFGGSQHNPYMAYFVGQIHLTDGLLVKPRSAEPVLFHRSMERGEAEKTGFSRQIIEFFDWSDCLERAQGNSAKAKALRAADMLQSCQLEGRVAVYGQLDLAFSNPLMDHLRQALPGIQWVMEPEGETVLDKARVTKDSEEINIIRHMGQVTTEVVGEIAEFLTSQRAANGVLTDHTGQPITIGQVKSRIRRMLAERGAELPSGLIFSAGRDAGLPHSVGDDSQPLPMGQTIVFDIYPAQAGGGYYYDFTRTWCLGHASDEIQTVYRDVLQIYEAYVSAFRVGELTQDYQIKVCQAFEALGHPSQLSDPKTQSGYVHGLGHGLGLSIHEAPSFSLNIPGSYSLTPGMVFTFEPGLYYPDRGIGVRIEDTLVVEDDGSIHTLVDYPKDLVLPVPGS